MGHRYLKLDVSDFDSGCCKDFRDPAAFCYFDAVVFITDEEHLDEGPFCLQHGLEFLENLISKEVPNADSSLQM